MDEKILFVDDEPHILESMRRQLRKRFKVVTAESGAEALSKMKNEGPFAVVVSDMRMPVMDGIELLMQVKGRYPDCVRMMLTGNADQDTAIDAVNKGHIFKFLTKPCPITMLVTSLALALRQYRLVTAEKELIDKTLKGSLKVLSELLSFTNPTAFSSGVRIRSLVKQVAEAMEIENSWHLEIAALISQIGCITLPQELLAKVFAGNTLSPEEEEMYNAHPENGADLLQHIPRLEGVTYIIRNQHKTFPEYDHENTEKEQLDLSAQILKTVFDYDLLRYQGNGHQEALRLLKKCKSLYNGDILDMLKKVNLKESSSEVVSLRVSELTVGMIAEEDIIAKNGTLLAPKGQEITWPVLQGLKNFSQQVGVQEPLRIRTTIV